MSSDLFVFNSSFSNPFSPFSDSSIEALQELSVPDIYNNNNNNNNPILQNPVEESSYFDQMASTLFSSSPQSNQIEDSSLYETTHFHEFTNFKNQISDFPVKAEEYSGHYQASSDMMQSNSFDGKVNFLFQSQIDALMETQLRRICSTGDLHVQPNHGLLSSSPLSTEGSFMETENFKVARYSEEVRREKIHRYRAKRNQRNFNKTIKYACRKTLADNRPRVRGRFARNDEIGDLAKATTFDRYTDDRDFWVDDTLNEEDGKGLMFDVSSPNQIHYYGGY